MRRQITLKLISKDRNYGREQTDIQKLGRFVVVLARELGLENNRTISRRQKQ